MKTEIIGKRIEGLMKKNKLTIKELAKNMKISSKTLSKKLKGEKEFYVSEIIKIIKIFNLDTESSAELLGAEENDESTPKVLN